MKKWLQRIRGAVSMGLTWAVGWSVVGVIIALVGDFVGVFNMTAFDYVVGAVQFATMGFVGGTIFSTVLGITEGRRRFDEMSLPRFAAWGAVGGLLMSGVMSGVGLPGVGGIEFAVFTLLGAGFAAGSLALARKAEDKELLEAGEEALGLTEGG